MPRLGLGDSIALCICTILIKRGIGINGRIPQMCRLNILYTLYLLQVHGQILLKRNQQELNHQISNSTQKNKTTRPLPRSNLNIFSINCRRLEGVSESETSGRYLFDVKHPPPMLIGGHLKYV